MTADEKQAIIDTLDWVRDFAKAKGGLHYSDANGGHSMDIGTDDLYWLIEAAKKIEVTK